MSFLQSLLYLSPGRIQFGQTDRAVCEFIYRLITEKGRNGCGYVFSGAMDQEMSCLYY
jgi:hypothetical protein